MRTAKTPKVDAKISHQEYQAGQMETDSTCLLSVHRQPASQQPMGCMIKLMEGKSKEDREKAGGVCMKVDEKVWEEGEQFSTGQWVPMVSRILVHPQLTSAESHF